LQIQDYHRAVVRHALPAASAREMQLRVELRMRRREPQHRPDAPQLQAIVDEPVLLRVLGSREVMRAQLDHLVEMARSSACGGTDRAAGRNQCLRAHHQDHRAVFDSRGPGP
jgi:hypothetical protein